MRVKRPIIPILQTLPSRRILIGLAVAAAIVLLMDYLSEAPCG